MAGLISRGLLYVAAVVLDPVGSTELANYHFIQLACGNALDTHRSPQKSSFSSVMWTQRQSGIP